MLPSDWQGGQEQPGWCDEVAQLEQAQSVSCENAATENERHGEQSQPLSCCNEMRQAEQAHPRPWAREVGRTNNVDSGRHVLHPQPCRCVTRHVEHAHPLGCAPKLDLERVAVAYVRVGALDSALECTVQW